MKSQGKLDWSSPRLLVALFPRVVGRATLTGVAPPHRVEADGESAVVARCLLGRSQSALVLSISGRTGTN